MAFVEQRQYTEFAFERLSGEMKAGFDQFAGEISGFEKSSREMKSAFERVERTLDQFIDTQSKTNALVERRLSASESARE